MRINADFTQISSSFQPLEAGEYQCVVEDYEEGEGADSKIPFVKFNLKVNDPNHPDKENFPLSEYITLQTKKGQPNRVGLGKVKAYAEAILGVDAANNAEGIDLDELKSGTVLVVVSQRSYNVKDKSTGAETGEQRVTNDVEKILPVS